MRFPLTVTAPAAGPVTLRVYAEDNSTAARTYADEILEDDLTQPMTIAAGESLTIYVGHGPYWVSTLIGGVEMASGEGVRKRVDEGHNTLTPEPPPWRSPQTTVNASNSADATTPGAVIKKIEVFDAAGASLGFLAVYDAIT